MAAAGADQMRGTDAMTGSMFSYVDLEKRVPKAHPLRMLRAMINEVLCELDADFTAMYAVFGRPSIAPEKLLRGMLLQIFFTVRSERQLMEQLDYNLLFRWFVGLGIDDPVWHHSTYSKNRERLLEGDVARKFFKTLLEHDKVKPLVSEEHFSVDGTLVEAWASIKSFVPKDETANDREAEAATGDGAKPQTEATGGGQDQDTLNKDIPKAEDTPSSERKDAPASPEDGAPGDTEGNNTTSQDDAPESVGPTGDTGADSALTQIADQDAGESGEVNAADHNNKDTSKDTGTANKKSRNEEVDFRGRKWSNATHTSKTDPEAQLYRKGKGKEAKLSFMGHAMIENRHGLVVEAGMTQATGTAEREEAKAMIERHSPGSTKRLTVGADKNFDTAGFISDLREMCVTPHVAQKAKGSAIDGRTTRHEGYQVSQRRRKMVEEPFGWAKTVGGMRRPMRRGVAHMGFKFTFVMAAYNLIRMPKLLGDTRSASTAAA